jgi:hypothetical protein
MRQTAAITVGRAREEIQQRWLQFPHHPQATFKDAPGDRGTEIYVAVEGHARLAKSKDQLRRFKQLVETGEIARSDAVPEGEAAEHKLTQRPAQPLDAAEREAVGV